MTASASADISAGSEGRVTSGAQPMPFWLAFSPYLLLTALIMVVELVPYIGEPLASIRLGLPFPSLETGYGVVTAATEAYSEISVLTHPGTLMLVSAVVAFGFFRSSGYIPAGRIDTIGVDTIKTSIPTVMAVMVFVPLALVLEGSGMIVELATGVAQVASAPVYALLSPLIGAVGGFVTGSNLSANILFGPLQSQAAAALELNPAIVLAAQTAGAGIGASIVISAVLLGLGAVGAHGETGNTIRRMLPYVAITLLAIALIALAGTLILPVSGMQVLPEADMDWLRAPVWQQGSAILLVVAGAIPTYNGAAGTELNAVALLGTVLFTIGVAPPLISQALAAHGAGTAASEHV